MKSALLVFCMVALQVISGAALAQPRKVTIATEASYAPWNMTEANGKIVGFEIDVAMEMCKRAKLDCVVIAQPWDGIIPALVARKFDAIMSGMNATDKRRETIAFSRSYAEAPNGLGASLKGPLANLPGSGVRFSLAGDKAAAQKAIDAIKPALKGKVIGVQTASIQANFLDQYLKDTVTVREYKTTEQRDLDLTAGRLDGIFTSLSAMRATFAKPEFKEFANSGPLFSGGVFGEGVSVGLRKDDTELKQAFDKSINEMLADGTLLVMSKKWFNSDYTPTK
ncbi:MAG: transporter substrate-binding domain-containing protein [Burkholderiales bacterium]|nr:transporter substrate-binding domain-containing protein [Burkholderiales bacterium]